MLQQSGIERRNKIKIAVALHLIDKSYAKQYYASKRN